MSSLYLGYDPGGMGTHGVAAINDRYVLCKTVRSTRDAIEWFQQRCQDCEPSGLGVDTLTLWSTGPAGWRPADRALRAAYPAVAASVTAPNSLYGAMSINGVAVALTLRRQFKHLTVTETHPKVLYFALTGARYDFANQRDHMTQALIQWGEFEACEIGSDHAWDALVSAFAAREWGTRRWSSDLHQLPPVDGEDLIFPQELEPHYPWPKTVALAPQLKEPTRVRPVPKQGGTLNTRRARDLWKIAVERLGRAGHDDVAQQIAQYRNARNERSGWDSWLKSEFPALWRLVAGANECADLVAAPDPTCSAPVSISPSEHEGQR